MVLANRSRIVFLLFCLAGLLQACLPVSTSTPTLSWTPLPVPPTVATPMKTAPPSSRSTQTPSACVDDALFLEDLTIPDRTVVLPGATLDKRWSVQNNGSCDWGPGYILRRIGEDPFEGRGEVALYPAQAGATVFWQVVLTAPSTPGDYISRWIAQSPNEITFGDEVFLLIIVEDPTPEPTFGPSPTP